MLYHTVRGCSPLPKLISGGPPPISFPWLVIQYTHGHPYIYHIWRPLINKKKTLYKRVISIQHTKQRIMTTEMEMSNQLMPWCWKLHTHTHTHITQCHAQNAKYHINIPSLTKPTFKTWPSADHCGHLNSSIKRINVCI
jgi:hypothetical protein